MLIEWFVYLWRYVVRFGAAYNDGYGINCTSMFILVIRYVTFRSLDILSASLLSLPRSSPHPDLAGPDMIKFGIESKYSCPFTSTAAFQEAIIAAMRDMKSICVEELRMTGADVSVGSSGSSKTESRMEQGPMARL